MHAGCRFADEAQPHRRQWTKQQIFDAIYKGVWQKWAEDTNKSSVEIGMSHGPMTAADRFLGADYQAVKGDHNRVTCNSLVLVKHTEDSPVGQPTLTTPYVGRVSVWMRHISPWVLPNTPSSEMDRQSQMIADVSWFRYKGLQPELHNCPVVSKGFFDYQDGNFEFCDNIEPVGVHVVPYNGINYPKANLTTDVAALKPNMD